MALIEKPEGNHAKTEIRKSTNRLVKTKIERIGADTLKWGMKIKAMKGEKDKTEASLTDFLPVSLRDLRRESPFSIFLSSSRLLPFSLLL